MFTPGAVLHRLAFRVSPTKIKEERNKERE
jgi:hypothetical protein